MIKIYLANTRSVHPNIRYIPVRIYHNLNIQPRYFCKICIISNPNLNILILRNLCISNMPIAYEVKFLRQIYAHKYMM